MSDFNIRTIYNPYIGTSSPIQTQTQSTESAADGSESSTSFSELLQRELNQSQTLTFSKHAQQRVETRQVEVTPQLMDKLNEAVTQAKEKGIEDALIISDSASFIVNVPSYTVVTTMNNNETKNRIFTNINGTVII